MALTPRQNRRILTQKVRDTVKALRSGEKAVTREILRELRRTRADISTILKEASRFDMPYISALRDEIDGRIGLFDRRMRDSLGATQDRTAFIGANLTDDILKTTGVAYGFPMISEELVAATKVSSADLVTGMADDMRRDISRSLRRTVLMGEDSFAAARKIDKIIGISKRTGYQNRSDSIARTEIGRMFSVARHAKDEQAVELVPSLIKEWRTAEDDLVRPSSRYPHQLRADWKWDHRKAHGQIREIKEPFMVSGEALQYPRDTSGSAGNVIKCRCIHISYPREFIEE